VLASIWRESLAKHEEGGCSGAAHHHALPGRRHRPYRRTVGSQRRRYRSVAARQRFPPPAQDDAQHRAGRLKAIVQHRDPGALQWHLLNCQPVHRPDRRRRTYAIESLRSPLSSVACNIRRPMLIAHAPERPHSRLRLRMTTGQKLKSACSRRPSAHPAAPEIRRNQLRSIWR